MCNAALWVSRPFKSQKLMIKCPHSVPRAQADFPIIIPFSILITSGQSLCLPPTHFEDTPDIL